MLIFNTKTCLYPNCFDDNIKSHAISRRFSLETIAENYHLYHFEPRQISRDEKAPHLKKISTLKATAQGVFCETHDSFFNKLDTDEIHTTRDILLQAYRSLCIIKNEEKEAAISIYDLNSPSAYDKIRIEDVVTFLDKSGYSNLIEKLDDERIVKIVKKKIHFLLSESVDRDLGEIEKLSDYLIRTLDFIEVQDVPTCELRTLTTKNMGYRIFYYKTDFKIPVSINAMTCGYFLGEKIKTFSVVVPYKESNAIIGIVPDKIGYSRFYEEKIDDYFSTRLNIITFVESLMSTCDGWFIKPSIIDNMSDEKKNFFIQDCMFYNERALYAEYDFSIFDDLKEKICTEDGIVLPTDKLSNIPLREDYELRYAAMLKSILN
ncbi:hypothetical protein H4F38_17060 [Pectobacterium brasiliense]|uniref:hypothetical protein n=1 Tax=Pectobacterium brasiliense TaxID=180957 RepID=UPI0019698EA4|nr:hypothetical protein [Pectobacterium brasiliense]MBN3099460.1 hypothetical protein [Pectobacterium brasiliense]MBN3102732.1 hypothetical protein [Pectobacterium brasiliense]MBN3165181.1 hypothetical protein [Pectobacterium brasiliense]